VKNVTVDAINNKNYNILAAFLGSSGIQSWQAWQRAQRRASCGVDWESLLLCPFWPLLPFSDSQTLQIFIDKLNSDHKHCQ